MSKLAALLVAGAVYVAVDGTPTHAFSIEPAYATPTSCAAVTAGDCLYAPATTFPVAAVPSIITVPADHRRVNVPVRVYYPAGALGPRPVVVWSHGGGFTPGANPKGQHWAQALAENGYIVLKLSHLERPAAEAELHCATGGLPIPNGVPASVSSCTEFALEHGRYDKPMDVHAVLDQLAAVEAAAQLADPAIEFDLDRVVVAGHSGGAAASMAVAGVLREVGEDTFDFEHPAPVAFVALSPQGPGASGWTASSYLGITRPVFTATGTDDDKGVTGKLWSDRIAPYDLMPAGDGKVRFFIDSDLASHTLFNLSATSHAPYHPWLVSAVTAFLDATVLEEATASAYLQDGDIAGELALDLANIPSGVDHVPAAWCWKRQGNADCVVP